MQHWEEMGSLQFVGDKAKRRISKRGNKKSTPNCPKPPPPNNSYLCTYTYTYMCVSGGKKCSFCFLVASV